MNRPWIKQVQLIDLLFICDIDLKSYNKANLDPFCRNDRITGWGDTGDIVTESIKLLGGAENRVLEYIITIT